MRRLWPRRTHLRPVSDGGGDRPADSEHRQVSDEQGGGPPWSKRLGVRVQTLNPTSQRQGNTLSETFSLATVLTVYHNKMCSSIEEMRALLDHMTGVHISLWEIPRARKMCADALGRRFTWLDTCPPPVEFRTDQANKYVKSVQKQIGAEACMISPLPPGQYQPINLTDVL